MRRVNEDLHAVEVLLLYSCFTALLTALLMRYCLTRAITSAATALLAFAHDLFAACSVTLLLLHLVRYCFTHAFLLY